MCLEDQKIGFQVLVATTAVRTALETGVNANDLHFSRTRCQFSSVAMPQKPIIAWCVCILPTAFALRTVADGTADDPCQLRSSFEQLRDRPMP